MEPFVPFECPLRASWFLEAGAAAEGAASAGTRWMAWRRESPAEGRWPHTAVPAVSHVLLHPQPSLCVSYKDGSSGTRPARARLHLSGYPPSLMSLPEVSLPLALSSLFWDCLRLSQCLALSDIPCKQWLADSMFGCFRYPCPW